MATEILKKFGRYFLLDQVAQGGMAEIYRARLASLDGAARILVIKRIQAGFGSNAEFQQMFKSETKVMMGFNHPNIVQLYDFGEEQEQPYIAMEHIDGRNLRQFLTRFGEQKKSFPVDLASYIIEQTASGLHYAHHFKDKISGMSLNIVHRDISPQNILISYEGTVKIIDFGIAKAATNSEATRAGVIKGKPSYLSPEQISGEVLDGRSDLFALGIVLWELLTGKKLFAGESDLAVLKLIENCNQHVKPPSTFNPQIPKELDYIVLKSLAKQREKRFQTGEEFQRALHKFLYTHNPDFNPSDLSYYAKDLFKNEIVEDRKKIQRLNDKVEQLLASEGVPAAAVPMPRPEIPENREPVVAPVIESSTRHVIDAGAELKASQRVEMAPSPALRGASAARPVPLPSSSVGGGEIQRMPPSMVASAPRTRQPDYSRASAQSEGGGGLLSKFGLLAAAIAAVAYFGPDFGVHIPIVSALLTGREPGIPVVRGTASTETPREQPSETATTPLQTAVAGQILLHVNVTPGGGKIKMALNGRPVSSDHPSAYVMLDAPLELSVERPGFHPFRREFYLDSKQLAGLKETLMEVSMEPLRYGFLTITSTPNADASIMIDGEAWVKRTPLENEKVPVGTYQIRLSNKVLGWEKTITVTVQDGKLVRRDVNLEAKD